MNTELLQLYNIMDHGWKVIDSPVMVLHVRGSGRQRCAITKNWGKKVIKCFHLFLSPFVDDLLVTCINYQYSVFLWSPFAVDILEKALFVVQHRFKLSFCFPCFLPAVDVTEALCSPHKSWLCCSMFSALILWGLLCLARPVCLAAEWNWVILDFQELIPGKWPALLERLYRANY